MSAREGGAGPVCPLKASAGSTPGRRVKSSASHWGALQTPWGAGGAILPAERLEERGGHSEKLGNVSRVPGGHRERISRVCGLGADEVMITMGSENVTSRTVWEFDCRAPWANGLSCSETIFSWDDEADSVI